MSGLEILAIVIGLAILGLLLRQIYVLNQKHHKIQTKAASLEDENARLWTTQSELFTEAKRLQKEVDRLTAENLSLSQKISVFQKADDLQVYCKVLESKQLELSQYWDQLTQTISDAEAQKQGLEAEIENLQKIIEEWRHKNDEIENKHIELLDRDYRLSAYPELVKLQKDLTQKIDNLEQENENLRAKISQTQQFNYQDSGELSRIKIISACHQHSTSDQELFHTKLMLDFNRVREALDFAETMFGDVLEVWDSARTSADLSNFIRPDDAYRALQSLAWFGQYYFEHNGAIGNNIYHILRERYNLECTPEAKNVLNNKKLRDERCFWHGSQRKEMFDHLKLGGGNGMNNILRIYFAINSESRKIEVGHCGKHP